MERSHDFFPGCVRFAHAHIFQNRGFDEAAVLKYKGNGIHQFLLGDVLHIHAANLHLPVLRVKEPADQIGKGRFATAGRSHKSYRLPCGNGKGNILDNLVFSIITEMDTVKLNRSVMWVLRPRRFFKRVQIQYAVDSMQSVVHDHGIFALEHDAA